MPDTGTFVFWWTCLNAYRELCEEPPFDDDHIIIADSSGPYTALVTAGEIRRIIRILDKESTVNELNPVLALLNTILTTAPQTKILVGRGKKTVSLSIDEANDPKTLAHVADYIIGELVRLKESLGENEEEEGE